jgi:hypothetical protein
MSLPTIVTLRPHRWTPIPGTRLHIRWDGDDEVRVHRAEFWDLSPLVRRGRVLAWARIADRPALGAWPIVPLTSRTTYRSSRSWTPLREAAGWHPHHTTG